MDKAYLKARRELYEFVRAWEPRMDKTGVLTDYDGEVILYMKDGVELVLELVQSDDDVRFVGTLEMPSSDDPIFGNAEGTSITQVLRDLMRLYKSAQSSA